MQLARRRLDGKERVRTLTFNGWLFEGYQDAKAALIGAIPDSIEDALRGTTRWTDERRDRVRRMVQRVDWLQALGLAMRDGGPVALTGDPRAHRWARIRRREPRTGIEPRRGRARAPRLLIDDQVVEARQDPGVAEVHDRGE
jgi:hypothetical protein